MKIQNFIYKKKTQYCLDLTDGQYIVFQRSRRSNNEFLKIKKYFNWKLCHKGKLNVNNCSAYCTVLYIEPNFLVK